MNAGRKFVGHFSFFEMRQSGLMVSLLLLLLLLRLSGFYPCHFNDKETSNKANDTNKQKNEEKRKKQQKKAPTIFLLPLTWCYSSSNKFFR